MTYRSMSKTNPDKMAELDQKNPELKQSQSVESNAYNESAVIAEQKQEEQNLKNDVEY